jgi:hypothetical protein
MEPGGRNDNHEDYHWQYHRQGRIAREGGSCDLCENEAGHAHRRNADIGENL